ncbi:MAG: SRPBCC domain-containing protein [Actinomycetota bacterium]|nr:SRPBCC domain-containing protein [Actinomycetota bacterium]
MTGLMARGTTTIDASKAAVWKGLTDPDQIKDYMMGSVVETDWQPGSPITWSGEWKGKPYQDKGEIVAVDEPDRLELTHYSPLTGQDDVPESYHTLVYTLEDRDGGTQVSVTQDNNADQDEADRNSQAWTQMLDGLKQTVEGS